MTKRRKGLKFAALVFVLAVLSIQAIRIDKLNPPVQSDIQADPAIQSLLRSACYNCHSNETVWPWYSNVAPISWLLASDVNEARSHLNFSMWRAYSSNVQSNKLAAIEEEVQSGDMPLWYYMLVHSEARLSQEDRSKISNWAESASRFETPRQ